MSAEITSAEIAALRMSRSRRMFSHTRWLVGASVMAMVFGSSSALAKPLVGPGSGTSAVTAAINAANQGQQQAQQIAQQSQNALSRTVQALQAMRAAQAAIRLTDVEALCEPDASGERNRLESLLVLLENHLRNLSDEITHHYLSHTGPVRHLGISGAGRSATMRLDGTHGK